MHKKNSVKIRLIRVIRVSILDLQEERGTGDDAVFQATKRPFAHKKRQKCIHLKAAL